MKKVSIGAKPAAGRRPGTADDWVLAKEGAIEPTKLPEAIEPMKRLTIDIPLSLHTRVKSQCALRNTPIVEVLREFLDKKFPPDGEGGGASLPAGKAPGNTETQKNG